MINPRARLSLVVLSLAALAACSSSDDTSTGPSSADATLQVNASTSTAYVALGAPANLVSVGDPTTSTAWDLAFTGTPTVAVNGGASGPGTTKAYCLCANSSLSPAQVEALTAAGGTTAFDAVTAGSIPADSLFTADAASQAISDWYDYNTTTHAVTPSANVWGIRLASSGGYAKFHVIALPTPGQSNAGPVTIQWAVQSSATGALGADQQAVVDLSSGSKVYVNLSTGATSASATSTWDIALQGYTISVNGGSSGSGSVGVVALVPSTFYTSYAAITSIPVGATGIPSTAFTTDGAGGAFLSAAPYRYDGNSHQVYPTYDVYLVKHGTSVYKVQITSYYNTGGVFGYLTLRYTKISG
ncbi:MAG TPA: HmuY family protein [Gemmatimonadaceae bacterium]|jgi:hypothetical protein